MANKKNPGLGLGLGLGAAGRNQFRDAASHGTLDDFLGSHRRAGRRFDAAAGAANPIAQSYVNQNRWAQPVPQSTPAPASNATPGGAAPGTPAPGTTPPAAPPSFMDLLNQQFGTNNPFSDMQFPTFQSLADAIQKQAKVGLDQDLAGVRARYGAQGLGTSSREALAEGAASGISNANVNSTLAQLGYGAQQSEEDRALSALGLGAQTTLGEGNQALNALQLLLGGGDSLFNEQNSQVPRLADLILPLLGNFANNGQITFGRGG